MGRRWKPSRSAAREFAQKMDEVAEYCSENKIDMSSNNDSYYFYIDSQHYRISNHTVEQSDRKAYDEFGRQVRRKYHDGRDDDTIYITAGKTRIIEIHKALLAGKELDGRGYVKEVQ